MKVKIVAFLGMVVSVAAAQSGDVLGAHDLSMSGGSRIKGQMSAACLYCHVPHSGVGKGPLWGQTFSSSIYTPYTSSTEQNAPVQPELGQASSLCLSCHDGTVAVGQITPYGPYTMTGTMPKMGTDLEATHPFSLQLPLKDAPDLVASLVASGTTTDPTQSVKLIKGNIECTSCHNPHNQRIDKQSPNFLVRDNAKGAVCLACHETTPRLVNGHDNPLTGWTNSVHAKAANLVNPAAALGGYTSVADFACNSCHASHDAGGAKGLLRASNETACVVCHSGGSNLSPAAPDVFAEYSKPVVHPFSSPTGLHDSNEDVLLNQNRHATCADCHNAHSANPVISFPLPPELRPSQNGIAGISASDGITIVKPAVNQYENCLRCHGNSTGKATNPAVFGYLPPRLVSSSDPLNVIPQFSVTATSSHPVTHDRTSPLAQPSLRTNMLNEDGITPGRAMGARILCSDCHNSDDNREFGGAGPNGPHGSKWFHLLERRYEYSQAAVPGGTITNLFPTPDLSVTGPYALCGKCHDLAQLVTNSSFTEHARHINDGFSCSVCHTPHGMGSGSSAISGERLVNFDANVVGSNGGAPISYNRGSNTCSLVCHNKAH
ncbi:MAG TPA: cytochrome c3 family protein [Terriglobales bacterium]|nr:cytochrome c3 family protein [Terriglobales bacterium]